MVSMPSVIWQWRLRHDTDRKYWISWAYYSPITSWFILGLWTDFRVPQATTLLNNHTVCQIPERILAGKRCSFATYKKLSIYSLNGIANWEVELKLEYHQYFRPNETANVLQGGIQLLRLISFNSDRFRSLSRQREIQYVRLKRVWPGWIWCSSCWGLWHETICARILNASISRQSMLNDWTVKNYSTYIIC